MMSAHQGLKKSGAARQGKAELASKRTTIIRWTGRGSQRRFESSISRVVGIPGVGGSVTRNGRSVLVEGPEPARVASLLSLLPGVSWVAAGMAARSFRELSQASSVLARRYLRPGDRFRVEADASGGIAVGDVAGSVVSAALEAVRGSRVDESRPKVRFRASFDGKRGAVGVELFEGPGGSPTGAEGVTCLVSGGKHSSVLSWMALLSGYRVRMVHARIDEESERAAAHLYAELSNRVDPSGLSLEVLRGGEPASLLLWRAGRAKTPIFAGFHSGCSEVAGALGRSVVAPLFLLPEGSFDTAYKGLSLRGYQANLDTEGRRARPASKSVFAGVKADVSQVLDGLR